MSKSKAESSKSSAKKSISKAKVKTKLKDTQHKSAIQKPKVVTEIVNKESKAKTEKTKSAKVGQRIRIRLKAFDSSILDQSVQKIVIAAQGAGASVVGPIPLPTQKKVWCVLKSPHVNKRGGEHYEIRLHKRVIYIVDPPSTAVDSLMTLDLPAGINIELKLN